MSDEPTKLTRDDLLTIFKMLCSEDRVSIVEADRITTAIRTMRLRAEAVCGSANPSTALSMVPGYEDETPVSTAALARLKEILP
jgi:hypothetical protein